MADSDAPFRSSSLLPQKRTRRSSNSQDAPPPRRAKSVSDVRLRPTLLASAASASSSSKSKADGKGKTKATNVTPTPTLGAEAEGWKGDMFGRFVEKALRDVEDYGDTTTYDDLVSQLRPAVLDPNAPSSSSSSAHPALIHPLLVGLTTHASLLSSTTHRTLIQALIHFPWSTADEGFVETYMRFMGVLVSLRMEWLGEVVKRCVKGFQYQPHFKQLLPSSPSTPLTRGLVYSRHHLLLSRLLQLIPTLPSLLLPLLLGAFPPKREKRIAQTVWFRNVLRVSGYCPAVGEKVWAAVLGRALQMDVEIQVEWDELEDAEAEAGDDAFSDASSNSDDSDSEGDPFLKLIEVALIDPEDDQAPPTEEDDDSDSESDASIEDEGELTESEEQRRKRLRGIKEMASKLDAVLNETFSFFSQEQSQTTPAIGPFGALPTPGPSRSATPTTMDQQRVVTRQSQFASVLSIFDALILRTFKSRYTQFLLFWFSSLSSSFTEDFLGLLLSKALFERDQPEVVRKAAASYVGSFVSRAIWVDGNQVRRVVDLLCQFLEAQLEIVKVHPELVGQFTKAGQRQGGLGVFYAVAQAVFLIFCFRWRDLKEEDEDDEDDLGMDEDREEEEKGKARWVEGLDVLERVVLSSFNPLKVCSPNVVTQFARISHESGFLFVYHIIASNNRSSSTTLASTSSLAPSGSLLSSLHQHSYLSSSGKLPTPTPRQERDSTRPEAVEEADLDSFFPFDPFRLPASSRYIDSIYRSWEGPADSDSDSDDDEDEDDDGEGNDTFSEEPLGRRIPKSTRRRMRLSAGGSDDGADVADLGRSFEQGLSMSVSPGMGLSARMGMGVLA